MNHAHSSTATGLFQQPVRPEKFYGFEARSIEAGYVGVGRVTGFSAPQMAFCVNVDGKQLLVSDVLSLNQLPDDPEKMELCVPKT
jgi:hypothetical protein